MKNRTEEGMDQKWFDEQLREPIERLDRLYEHSVPELAGLESFIKGHKSANRKKQLRELAWLWIAGCFIFGLMMWLANENIGWFIGMQLAVAAGALLFASMSFGRRLTGRWKS